MPRNLRFQRPEFQEKLARARRFERRAEAVPSSFWSVFLAKVGLGSRITKFVYGLLILIIFYFLAISQFFLVKEVKSLTATISSDSLDGALSRMSRKRIAFMIPANHIILVNHENFLAAVQEDLPSVRAVRSFRKSFPNKVEVELEERQPRFVWRSGEDYYLLDQEGVIFQKVLNYSPETYSQSLVADMTASPVNVGAPLPVKDFLSFAEEIKEQWPDQVRLTNFSSFSVPGIKGLDIFVKTAIGFEVYFDLKRSAARQLANLNFVLKEEIKPETYAGLAYIDLRLPTIAYYCYKDAPCAPQPKL